MKSIFVLFILCISSFSWASTAKYKVRVGLFQAEPFAYRSAGKIVGVTKMLVDKLLGHEFDLEYFLLPYPQVVRQLDRGYIDLAVMYANKKMDQAAINLGPTLGNDNLLISYRNNSINSITELKGQVIAKIRGANYGNIVSNSNVKIIDTLNYKQSLNLLKANRVKGFLISSAAWVFYQRELKLQHDQYHELVLNFKNNSIYARKGLPLRIRSRISALNNKYLKDSKLKKLDALLLNID